MSMEAMRRAGNNVLHGIHVGCDVAIKAISRTDILAKISALVVRTFNLLQRTLSRLPEYVGLITIYLKEVNPILSTIDCLRSIYLFATKKSTWMSIISQVSYIFSSLIGVARFADKLGIVNFGSVTAAVGGERVVTGVASSLSLVGASFGLADNINDLYKASKKNSEVVVHGEVLIERTLADKKEFWEARRAELLSPAFEQETLANKVNFFQRVWRPSAREGVEGLGAPLFYGDDAVSRLDLEVATLHSRNKIERRIQKYDLKLANASVAHTKTWMAIADNVAKIILGVLGLISLAFGVACLAPTTLPFIIAGVVLSAYSVFRSIYSMCKEEKKQIPLTPLDRADWARMRAKIAHANDVHTVAFHM